MAEDPQIIIDLRGNVTGHRQHQVLFGLDPKIPGFHHGGSQIVFHHIIVGKVVGQFCKNRQSLIKLPRLEPGHRLFTWIGLRQHHRLLTCIGLRQHHRLLTCIGLSQHHGFPRYRRPHQKERLPQEHMIT